MTVAWYGHLKFKEIGMPLAITVSWGIALIEYCFAVPANRTGFGTYSAAELKTIQEVITLVVFAGFSVLVLGEALNWGHGVGFALIALGATFIFQANQCHAALPPHRRRIREFRVSLFASHKFLRPIRSVPHGLSC